MVDLRVDVASTATARVILLTGVVVNVEASQSEGSWLRGRRASRLLSSVAMGCACAAFFLLSDRRPLEAQRREAAKRPNLVLGRPTATSMAVSVGADDALEAYVEVGLTPGQTIGRTPMALVEATEPTEFTLNSLRPGTYYFYRVRYRRPGDGAFGTDVEYMFSTTRRAGTAFTFGVQADAHPDRDTFDPSLYGRTLGLARRELLDFYVLLGDDFSLDRLLERGNVTRAEVDLVYRDHRARLASFAASTPLFLVNGPAEHVSRSLLDGTDSSPAVLAARARARFFPLPLPGEFYTGNPEDLPHIGLLRNYYAWTWGDAMFIVLDPYWHSPSTTVRRAGDTEPQQGAADGWSMTLGDEQYKWLQRTLVTSRPRYTFVFTHQTGAGAAGDQPPAWFEWDGRDPTGRRSFAAARPGWELPIHELLAKTGVTMVFRGHAHGFARDDRDGIVYQTVPRPADASPAASGAGAVVGGTTVSGSGHLRVNVSTDYVRVDFVQSYLPKDEGIGRVNGDVAVTYTVPPPR